MNMKINIKETSQEDLLNVLSLWNNGEVMTFVGYPEGLGMTMEKLNNWLLWAIAKPDRCHYSIYHDELGYCGETFYNVNQIHGLAALDIKLFPKAQGRGIAKYSLEFSIEQAFFQGNAKRVYVDPHPKNMKAWQLYETLGFQSQLRPDFLVEWDSYLELTRDQWLLSRK